MLKDVTALFVERVYGLELQAMVNYSGLKGKFPLKQLKSTDMLLGAYMNSYKAIYIVKRKHV